MKKLIITLILVSIAAITVWAMNRKKEDLSQYVPQEQPISEQNQKEMEPIRKALVKMCSRGEWKKLEKCFSLSEADRLFAKQEYGEDPLDKYVALLKTYAPLMQNASWEMTELVENHNSLFFRIPDNNGKKLCINITKRKGEYRLRSVEEFSDKKNN